MKLKIALISLISVLILIPVVFASISVFNDLRKGSNKKDQNIESVAFIVDERSEML